MSFLRESFFPRFVRLSALGLFHTALSVVKRVERWIHPSHNVPMAIVAKIPPDFVPHHYL
jgi:hypothetical protein